MDFLCPVCKSALSKQGKSYICQNMHCFDLSKEGYVNLAAAKGISSLSGDSPEMAKSRHAFLSGGYYEPLAKKLAEFINKQNPSQVCVLDAGCGEGYYTRCVRENLTCDSLFYGIDLSKESVKIAAKCEKVLPEEKRAHFAVAGIFDLPFADNSFDFIISVFAPISECEFSRVLKQNGKLIIACPDTKHLYSFKEQIYDKATENIEKIQEFDEFELEETFRLTYDINVENQHIFPLFQMTPYFWKSSRETQNKVSNLDMLCTQCDFLIKVYSKK